MILQNIDWESVKDASTPLAKAVRYAERWAEKVESAIASGSSFEGCLERCGKESVNDEVDQGIARMAIGLMYSCWKRGDEFKDWYRRHKDRDLSEYSCVTPRPGDLADSPIAVVPPPRLWKPGDPL